MPRPFIVSLTALLAILVGLAACGTNSVAPTAVPAATTSPLAAPAQTEPAPPAATAAPLAAPTLAASTPIASATPISSTGSITDTEQFFTQILNAPHDTIKSSDGSAELLIPNGALPPGTSANDIKITAVDPAQLQVTLGGHAPTSAYHVEPDGVKLNQPILLRLKRDTSRAKEVSSLFTISGDQGTALSPVVAAFDTDSHQVTLMATMTHFSTLVEAFNVRVEMPDEMDEPIGTRFIVQAFVTTQEHFRFLDITGRADPWTASEPVVRQDNGTGPYGTASGSLNDGLMNLYDAFTCQAVGDGNVQLNLTIHYHDTYYEEPLAWLFNQSWDEHLVSSTKIHCKAMTPTPTPKPTGSQVRGAAPPAIGIDLKSGGSPVGDSVLIAQDNQTQVRADVKPNGTNASQLASIQQGTCQQPGAVKYPLSNVVNNSSQTVIDASLASLLTGNLVVNVQQSGNKSVACGAIPKGSITTLGPGRDGDQSPAYAILLAAGNQTQVILNVGLTEETIDQPAVIYAGSCANLGSAKYPLGSVKFGALHTTLNAGLDTLLKGGYAVALAKSTTEPNTIVACGDIK